jgi:hypothetical protein
MGSARKADFLKRYPFAILLAALFLLLMGSPFSGRLAREAFGLTAQASIAPLVLLLIISAGLSLWSMKHRGVTIFCGGIALALVFLSTIFSQDALTVAHLLAQSIFVFYVSVIVAKAVFRSPIVDGNILCGAACLYMLTGVLIGFIYCLVEFLVPGSFQVTNVDGHLSHTTLVVDPGWLVYFSFTTLTTVGLGDILPTSPVARSFAALEAVIGQIIVVVMIARLVGINVAQITSQNHGMKNRRPPSGS